MLQCARPIMLEGANPRDNGDEEGCRPTQQDDAVGALDRPQKPPTLRQRHIAVTDGRIGGRGEIKCVFEGPDGAYPAIQRRVAPNLHAVQYEQAEGDPDQDQHLQRQVPFGLQPGGMTVRRANQDTQTQKMHDDGQSSHGGGDDQLRCEALRHRRLLSMVWLKRASGPTVHKP